VLHIGLDVGGEIVLVAQQPSFQHHLPASIQPSSPPLFQLPQISVL
jgi:hypothetical protein